MTEIKIVQVEGLEDRLKKIEDRIKVLEGLIPEEDGMGGIIIKTREKEGTTEK